MRYMGSKRRIADEILPIMLEDKCRKVFVDAFCGGCGVISHVPSTYSRIANDKNKYLIEMWKGLLRSSPFPLIITRNMYDMAKSQADSIDGSGIYNDWTVGWIGFMASFNGKFFNGYTGHDVVDKDGKRRNYICEYISNIMKDLPLVKGVNFVAGSYDELKIPQGSIVYCDPPYRQTTNYPSGRGFDYESFYIWCEKMASRGNKVFISEYQMPSEFKCVWEKEVTNSLNPTRTTKTVERLFTIGK